MLGMMTVHKHDTHKFCIVHSMPRVHLVPSAEPLNQMFVLPTLFPPSTSQYCPCRHLGQDPHDATSSAAPVTDYAAALPSADSLDSKPLQGKRVGVIAEMMQGGVAPGVASAVQNSIRHLESLGADISEVS